MAPPHKRPRLSSDEREQLALSHDDGKQPTTESPSNVRSNSPPNVLPRSIFVRSLAATTTSEQLTEHFSQSYPVKHAVAILDRSTRQCKGYGFVTFADGDDAKCAKDELNGSSLDGRNIKIDYAEPRHRGDENRLHTELEESVAPLDRGRDRLGSHQSTKLIVRNLPWSVKEPEQLEVLFSKYGKIKHASIPQKKPGLMCGFGFIIFRGRKNAENAIEAVNGKIVDGRTLAVDWAVDKDTWESRTRNQHEASHEADKHAPVREFGIPENPPIHPSSDSSSGDESRSDVGSAAEDDQSYPEREKNGTESVGGNQDAPIEISERKSDNSATVFVRNLPFTCTDEDLEEHFSKFGNVRYARVVLDRGTERPKGTGFVCFAKPRTAEYCLKGSPLSNNAGGKPSTMPSKSAPHSILQDEDSDPTGRYTMDGRILLVSRAVDRSEAVRLTAEGIEHRGTRDMDKRRLYLLSEGVISSTSPLYDLLSPSEMAMREASAKQRKNLVETNPSLHLSLTRLSVRNLPRAITSKDLKALAREAMVGFATDVKAGTRQALSKEELARGGEEMREAERERKLKAKGIVRQAKVVFESKEGSKVDESIGSGRSRGYGFIEYYTHRSALMGLRWLNGHTIAYRTNESRGEHLAKEGEQEKKKRLIVEFAIENAQVIKRRKENESKDRGESYRGADSQGGRLRNAGAASSTRTKMVANKRKREGDHTGGEAHESTKTGSSGKASRSQTQSIIAAKRRTRREKRRKGAA